MANTLERIRNLYLGVPDAQQETTLNYGIYLQQIRDAILGVTNTQYGSLNTNIYLQQIRNAILGVPDGEFGNLNSAIYLQQIRNAINGVSDGQFGSLDEGIYWAEILEAVLAGGGASDVVAPVPVITSTETSPTLAATIPISIDFGEVVTGFVVGAINAVGCNLSGFTDAGGGVFTATATPTAAEITIDIAAEVAQDAAGNLNTAAVQFAITATRFGMSAYWTMDEVSTEAGAVTRNDSIGTSHLTDNNTVASGTGKVSRAADFEIGNIESLSVTSNAALVAGDIDFTLGAWVKFESAPNTGEARSIIGKYNYSANKREYALLWERSDGVSLNHLRFTVSGAGTAVSVTNRNATSLGTPQIDTWYFVVAWHDATANTINIQVNDGAVDSVAHTTGVFASDSLFQIGWLSNLGAYNMDGLVDEPFICKRILSAAEKTYLYNSGNGRSLP